MQNQVIKIVAGLDGSNMSNLTTTIYKLNIIIYLKILYMTH